MGRPAGQPRCLHRLHASRLRPALARGGPGSDRGELCVLPRGFLHSFVKLSQSPSGRRGARPAAGRGALAFLWGRLSPLSPRVRKTRTRRSAWGAETGQARDRKHGLLGSARCCFVCTSHPRPGLALGRTLHEFCLGGGGAVPGCARALQGAACLQPRVSCGLCPSLVPTQVVKWLGQTQCLRLSPDPGARPAESIWVCLWRPAALVVCPPGLCSSLKQGGGKCATSQTVGFHKVAGRGGGLGGATWRLTSRPGWEPACSVVPPWGRFAGVEADTRAGPPRTRQACSVVGSLQWLC